jgi:hypothetical protein
MTHRILPIVALAAASLLVGCDSSFGTNEGGLEPGYEQPGWDGNDFREPTGNASFEVIGVSPQTAEVGDQIEIYTLSPSDASVDLFENEDFWYCFFDGESAMVETGGDDYDPDVPVSDVLDNDDIDINADDIDGMIVSTTTVTVPSGSLSGETLIITPGGNQYFNFGVD